MKIFEYIYYRVNKFYFKWDGRNGHTSVIAVSMVQCLILNEVLAIILTSVVSDKLTKANSKPLAYFAVVIFFGLVLYNYKKFKNKYNFFKARWGSETKAQKIIRGFLVILALILPWITLMIFIMYEGGQI